MRVAQPGLPSGVGHEPTFVDVRFRAGYRLVTSISHGKPRPLKMAFADTHPRIEQVLGHSMPPEHSISRLEQLPADVETDAKTLHERCGSLMAFAYLFHVTDASFGDVKAYCAARGWTTGVDD